MSKPIAASASPRGRVIVLGSANMDLVLRVDAIPAAGETVLGSDVAFRPGGKGANQAVAAALAGADVVFVGAVGDDAHGAALRAAMVAAGVDDTRLRMAPDRSSGIAVVMVAPDGENAIAVSPGANHSIGIDEVSALGEELHSGDVLLMQMEVPHHIVALAVEAAAGARATVLLNLAPAAQVPSSVLKGVQVLVVNRTEAEFLLQRTLSDVQDMRAATSDLLRLGPAAVVLTAGSAGAFAEDSEGVLHVPALAVDAVDTAGAGDAFVGILAAELSRGRSLRTAIEAGTLAGAVAVQSHGAQLISLVLPPGADAVGGR